MRSRKLSTGIAILAISFFLLQGLAGAAAKYTIKVGHNQMEKTVFHQSALKFKALVEQRTKGDIQIQVYPAQQLGNDMERLQAQQMGTLECSIATLPRISSAIGAVQIYDLPFLFPSYDVLFKVTDGKLGAELNKLLLQKLGIVGVTFWHTGFKQFTANTPIHKPEDLKGLKIRTMENPLIIAQYRALGANPVPIDFHELYTSLQQKVVDGEENDINTIHDMKFYEVQKYMSVSNHAWIGQAFSFSKAFWDKLPKNYQDILAQTARETGKEERAGVIAAEKDMTKKFQDSGMNVIYLNAQELDAFAKKMRPVHDQFADKIGKDLVNLAYKEVQAATK